MMEIWSQTAISVITMVSLRRRMRAYTAADENDREFEGEMEEGATGSEALVLFNSAAGSMAEP